MGREYHRGTEEPRVLAPKPPTGDTFPAFTRLPGFILGFECPEEHHLAYLYIEQYFL